MKPLFRMLRHAVLASLVFLTQVLGAAPGLERLKYNHPGLTVDLGVGLWAFPLPMDLNGDGVLDLAVSCPDKPYNGTYFFEAPNLVHCTIENGYSHASIDW
jgi:hypothetical protein